MRIRIVLVVQKVNVQRTKDLISYVTKHELDVVDVLDTSDQVLQVIKTSRADCVLYDPVVDAGALLGTWRDDVGGYPVLVCISFGKAIEHAMLAFEAGAVHFIVSPLQEQKLANAIERVGKKLSQYPYGPTNGNVMREAKAPFESKVISLPTIGGFDVRSSEQIVRVQGEGNYTRVVFMKDPSVLVCRCIGDYEAIVTDAGFVRVHRSSFVNIMHIRKMLRGKSARLQMANGDEVDVSDRYRDVLFEALHVVGHRRRVLV